MIATHYPFFALCSIAILWSSLPFPSFDVASLPSLILFEIDDEDSSEHGAGGAIFRQPELWFFRAGRATVVKLRTGLFTECVRWTPMTVRGPPLV